MLKRRTHIRRRVAFSVAGDLAFSPDGRLLATAETPAAARLWEVASGRLVRTLPRPAFGDIVAGLLTSSAEYKSVYVTHAVAFSPDGRLLATAESRFQARLCEVTSGTEVRRILGDFRAAVDVAFSPDGRLLATAEKDGTAVGGGLGRPGPHVVRPPLCSYCGGVQPGWAAAGHRRERQDGAAVGGGLG